MSGRTKLPLLLTEMTVMILVFAACAAVCLSLFAKARTLSRDSGELSRASAEAQYAAEAYKAAKGDSETAAELLGAAASGEGWELFYDKNWNPCDLADAVYTLRITSEGGEAFVSVHRGDMELYALTAKAVRYG